MNKRPVVIDTDLTVDDAFALMLAASCSDIEIKAVTAAGSQTATAENINALCKTLGIDCIVAKGAEKPMLEEEFAQPSVYGEQKLLSGLLTKKGAQAVQPCAWDTIYSEAVKAEGNLEIITLGPVTNIAITLLRYPQIKPLVKRIVCMAGSGYVGNIAPYSEYNAYCDPYALKVVFNSGVPVVMCGLDAVENCSISIDNLNFKNEIANSIAQIYKTDTQLQADKKVLIPAAAAMTYFTDSSTGTAQQFYTAVETVSLKNKGWTVVDRLGKYKKQPNISVVTDIQSEAFSEMLFRL